MPTKDLILTTQLPEIPLRELTAADNTQVSEVNSILKVPEAVRSAAQKLGSDIPLIKINSVFITHTMLESVILDETGFIPKITVIFKDYEGIFNGPNYPKKDPILSIYYKTQNEKFKPIRSDFLITSIKSVVPTRNNDSVVSEYVIKGELFLPKVYDNVSRAYSNVSSKDALLQFAKDVGLGFAENECAPNDAMTWISPNQNGFSFIKHVIDHAYQNDDSFFMSFIDKYYHLNYINVTNQLEAIEPNVTYINTADASKLSPSQLMEKYVDFASFNDATTPLFLTNYPEARGESTYLLEYSLMGDQGEILKNKGYRKKIYYYDHTLQENDPKEKFVDFFVNPIRPRKASEESTLVPEDIDLRNSVVKKWVNIDYGNSHPQWNAARLINHHNLKELNKIKMKAKLPGINFQVIKGSAIPALIFTPTIQAVMKNQYKESNLDDKLDDFGAGNLRIDVDLSGGYFVSGIKYIYDRYEQPFMYTELELSRVFWLSENSN